MISKRLGLCSQFGNRCYTKDDIKTDTLCIKKERLGPSHQEGWDCVHNYFMKNYTFKVHCRQWVSRLLNLVINVIQKGWYKKWYDTYKERKWNKYEGSYDTYYKERLKWCRIKKNILYSRFCTTNCAGTLTRRNCSSYLRRLLQSPKQYCKKWRVFVRWGDPRF